MLKAGIHSFLMVLLCTVFLISFSVGGSYAYETLNPTEKLIEKGTLVSSISIGELTNEAALQLIEEETDKWREANTVSFHYMDKDSTISASELFYFDFETSLQLALKEKAAPLFVMINQDRLDETLLQLSDQSLGKMIDHDLLKEHLMEYAQSIKNEVFQVNIHDYLLEEYLEDQAIISESYIYNLSSINNGLNEIIKGLNGYQINPKSETSFNSILEELNLSEVNNHASGIVATAIYQGLLETNFEIRERHISNSLPDYSELGFEADVLRDERDLRFYNPNSTPYTFFLKFVENDLSVSIKGFPLRYNYRVKLKEEQTFEPRRVLQYSANVAFGEKLVKQEGKDGYAVKVYRQAYDRFNQTVIEEFISEDFYRPTHIIEVRSLIETEASNPSNDIDQGIQNPDDEVDNSVEKDEEFENDDSDPIKGY